MVAKDAILWLLGMLFLVAKNVFLWLLGKLFYGF